jgi:hypothetical protein
VQRGWLKLKIEVELNILKYLRGERRGLSGELCPQIFKMGGGVGGRAKIRAKGMVKTEN